VSPLRPRISALKVPRERAVGLVLRAIGRLIDRLGGPDGLAVAYEAGPFGYALLRLLGRLGVACDVIAPSLVPVRPVIASRPIVVTPRSSSGRIARRADLRHAAVARAGRPQGPGALRR
jgi:hypothetical protein